ncbi:MAG TPA: cytochrome b/b6 domain-containing protein [Rhodanobacteraceae bacterium]|nr:cytochrome b/b6 domain-containing protein [Casimicrobiaceae bacterium]
MNDSAHPAIPSVARAHDARRAPALVRRHAAAVRVMHWINVVAIVALFMSGLGIFNAHPALYWGESSYSGRPAWLEIGARDSANGEPIGYTRIGAREFDTSGVLGLSRDEGRLFAQAFPAWLAVPSHLWLALSRSWHFFFAWIFLINGLCFVLYTLGSGHLTRDLLPTRLDLRGIGRSIVDHLRLRHPTGAAATRYNVLQKIAYLVVVFVLLPLVVLMGLGMSPRLDTLFGGWVGWFGGRQSVRSIHFIVAWLLVAFVLVHVFEVLVNGPLNQLRSMITGWYRVPREKEHG